MLQMTQKKQKLLQLLAIECKVSMNIMILRRIHKIKSMQKDRLNTAQYGEQQNRMWFSIGSLSLSGILQEILQTWTVNMNY